jgi:hypothetical protein
MYGRFDRRQPVMIDILARDMSEEQRNRRAVLVDTLTVLYDEGTRNHLRNTALENVNRWRATTEGAQNQENELITRVIAADWGEACLQATKEFGVVFACLNMANAKCFGGGYVYGKPTQEENMFYRTDCHFSCDKNLMASKKQSVENAKILQRTYNAAETALINGDDGVVFLDMTPRICIKGPEVNGPDSFARLGDDEIFPFYELRSAALDLRKAKVSVKKQEEIMRRKIKAQFNTLIQNGLRHVILSAFGCGAFLNDVRMVAKLYKEELAVVRDSFSVVIFAIYHAGYEPDNFTPFKLVFEL